MRQKPFPSVVVLLAVFGVIAMIGAVAAVVSLLSSGTSDHPGLRTEDLAPAPRLPTAYEHLERFQDLADEHGDRAAGTSGYEAAARYVEDQLARAGFESSRDYFTFEHRGEQVESFSVIVETEGGDDGNVIMLGAHLDGVPGSPALSGKAQPLNEAPPK